jgi:hypothetical protein
MRLGMSMNTLTKAASGLLVLLCMIISPVNAGWNPSIPKVWDEEALRDFELPLPLTEIKTKYISSDYYYRIPVRPIYKTYPIYYPEKEPSGYIEWLKKQEPEIIFDQTKLQTKDDWIRAGQLVFEEPILFVESDETLFSLVRDIQWYKQNKIPIRGDGIFPNFQYVIREKGKIEIGILACGQCHTRVMPDGSSIKGAQGNFPDDRSFGYELRIEQQKSTNKDEVLKDLRADMRRDYAAPWIKDDLNAKPDRMSVEEIASALETIPAGACARQGSSIFYPTRIPDLIGVQDLHFLDATGHNRHRNIGDLMRYAVLNQGADELSTYGDFIPTGSLQDPSKESRYSDEQLYALALYVYSLKPPKNPNPFNALAARGKVVFDQTGCFVCHPAPLYTNNQLTPVQEFQESAIQVSNPEILQINVDTDPNLTLHTRRGSGYYKVPSLRGVWYRGPFEHNGSVATLEDWFDPKRLNDDYVPTAFVGFGVKTRAVKGHPFGLSLSKEDRDALIAFLKTL